MSKFFSRVYRDIGRKRGWCNLQDLSKNVGQFVRGNSSHVNSCPEQSCTLSTWNPKFLHGQQSQLNIFKFHNHSSPSFSSAMEMILPVRELDKPYLPCLFPSSFYNRIFENIIPVERQPTSIVSDENNGILMSSLVKKRRRKMNRQKYKKRRKRDRFKREALKNLRERKRQRKERTATRKQLLLSKMVVNKSISKRRSRYLSHKLLPGVVKGQSIN